MTTRHAEDFGSILRRHRRAAGLTQEALAERATLSVRGIQDLERGVSQSPRPATVHLLAQALHLTSEERAALLRAGDAQLDTMVPPAGPIRGQSPGLIPLVGRAAELSLLDQFLLRDDAGVQPAPLFLLAGEPGIGKTRLLQVAAQRALGQGWTVLAGGCYRSGGQEPYSPVVDALAQYLHALPPGRLPAVSSGCGWLVRLLPELAPALEPLPMASLAPGQERRLLFAAVSRLLANVAGSAGTLLVLDDLQWAGPDALDLLASLVRTPSGLLRILGSYRDTDVRPADPLGVLLGDLAHAGLVQRQRLSPLDEVDAAALLGDLLVGSTTDRNEAQHVLQRAGGTPFFLVSYAQSLAMGEGDTVPWDLAQGVRQRMALLPLASREILAAVATAGRRVAWPLLVEVIGLPEDEMLTGLDEALQARLLLEEGFGSYAFVHDVIREVVEAGIGRARRAVLHRKVAQALQAAPESVSVELLAYHYARSDLRSEAVEYVEQAGDEAWAKHAHAAAEDHYRDLLQAFTSLGAPADIRRAREKLANVLYARGQYDAAMPMLEGVADELAAAGEWGHLAQVTARLGWAHSRRGTPTDGIARIEALLDVLNRRGEPPPIALYAALGQLLFGAGEYRASLLATEQAAEHAHGSGDDLLAALVDAQLINILQTDGRLEDALRIGTSVFPRIEGTNDLDALRRAYGDLACIHAFRGELEAARQCIPPALRAAERTGDPILLALPLSIGAWIDIVGGEWKRADAALQRALALKGEAAHSWYAPYPLIFAGRLALVRGDCEAARSLTGQALSMAERSGDVQAVRWASPTVMELQLRVWRPGAALAHALPLLDRPGLEECDVTTLLPLLAQAYLQLDEVEEAHRQTEQALTRARREGMRPVLVEALRVDVMIAMREERWEDGRRSLSEGLALAREIGVPYGEARLLRTGASLWEALGHGTAAQEGRQQAEDIFRGLGAAGDVAEGERSPDPSRPSH